MFADGNRQLLEAVAQLPVNDDPRQALADFWIFKAIADAWGCADMFEAWRSPEDVFRILGRLTEGRPCDISGLPGYEFIDENGGVQWPFPPGTELEPRPEGSGHAERRLFEDG